MMARLDGQVPVRFTENQKAGARQCAAREGMSASAWIRLLVDREIARRAGRCRCCGQSVPHSSAETVPDMEG
jgi:hypothetical protein